MAATTLSEPRGNVGLSRLTGADLVALVGAAVLAGSLFVSWYQADPAIPAAQVAGEAGRVSGWDAHPVLRLLLLATTIGAVLSACQTVRGRGHAGNRGEGLGFFAILAAFLIAYLGLIDRPGEPSGTIDLEPGWFLALGASLAVVATALAYLVRSYRRSPPGV